ncbi:MAG: diguanylate cyclase [Candidatus Dormibacter sp.]
MDHSRAEGNPRDHARLPHGSALLPVFSISDRATIAYEVISRSPSEVDPIALAHEALDSAQQTSPAVLFVPCPEENLPDIGAFQPAELATRPSVVPSEVAWILPGDSSADEGSAGGDRAAELRAAGFLLALEAEGWPTVGHDRILAVRPDYLLLRTELVAGLRDSLTARAELAGLISFAARLDVRLIARGVDDQATAMTLVALGVQFGSGEHLSAPLVLDAAVAIPGDEVVGPTWFRQHEPRKLEAPERAALVPTRVADLPKHAVEAPADDTFAHALGEIAQRVQAEHDPMRILNVITELLPRIMPMSALAIFDASWETDTLRPLAVAGQDIEALRDQPFPMSKGITGWAFMRGLPYNCDNTLAHPAASTVPGTERDDATESLLVIPLVAGDHRIGVLDVWRNGANAFSTRDLEHCALVAHVTAAAWHNAQLYHQLEDRARTDSLTGLHNTRWWDEVAAQEAARVLRSGAKTGVLLLDLDHFKRVNDTGGHAAGDRTLRNVARTLRAAVRTGDEVVRFGGEEFLILLHESGMDGALRVAETVRHAVATMPHPEPGPPVTASIGVAVFPANGPTLDDAVRAADLAMYRAKAQGRNRVAAAESAQPSTAAASPRGVGRTAVPTLTFGLQAAPTWRGRAPTVPVD